MEIRIEGSAPEIDVPPSMMFGHPTRLVDAWVPDVERLYLPGFTRPASPYAISVRPGSTRGAVRRVASRNPFRWWRRRGTLSFPGRLLLDGRFDFDGNMAHLLDNIASRVILARQAITHRVGTAPGITLILRSDAGRRAQDAFDTLAIPVVCTDAEVTGDIVTVEGEEPRALLPSIYDLHFRGYSETTPDRVFISRKGDRRLRNEEEVTALLQRRGFVRFYFEEIPVPVQWSIFRNAKEVVAVHGAALAAMVFQHRPAPGREPLRVLELFGGGYVVNMYRQYAALWGNPWSAVRGEVTPEILRDLDFRAQARSHALSPALISPKSLELALDYLASGDARSARPAWRAPALEKTTGDKAWRPVSS